jgi:hypothetical protein
VIPSALLLALICFSLWLPFALLTAVGSVRRGEHIGSAVIYGLAFPVTWVVWFISDNHRAGRKAFRPR